MAHRRSEGTRTPARRFRAWCRDKSWLEQRASGVFRVGSLLFGVLKFSTRWPKNFVRSCRFAARPFDNRLQGKLKPRRIDMRFISIFTHEPTNRPPTEAEMATMGKLIEDGMKAGWLVATEGVHFGATGVRVHKNSDGKVMVTDGPFAETKEVIGGYALLKAATKDEVVELTRRFLNAVGQGTCEIYQLYEMPTGG